MRARSRARHASLRFVSKPGLVFCLLFPAALAAMPALAKTPVPKPKPGTAAQASPQPEGPTAQALTKDMDHAIPAEQATGLPSTAAQYQSLQQQAGQAKPAVEDARRKSEALAAQTARLKQRLIATAAHVQDLEAEKLRLDADIGKLSREEKTLSQNLERDRVKGLGLLAVLERLQRDMPPVLAIKTNDVLDSAHAAMLLGASLPRVYGAAAELARRLEALRSTRVRLVARRARAARNATQLHAARYELDQLLAMKQQEAAGSRRHLWCPGRPPKSDRRSSRTISRLCLPRSRRCGQNRPVKVPAPEWSWSRRKVTRR